ncbi:MAG: hypothetical protein BWY06_02576 [Candidatus Latescibacteria bacterium ADurb.Bin168]|nr:MAG: hypothetical protein BWY06_02576 [Candidatus Latescibacteria bacterium ADurb.Bin168]
MRATPLPLCSISAGRPVLVGASAGHFWFSDLKRMASGRVLCCVGTLPDKPADPGHSARVLFSDDRGETWREHPEQIIPGASNISLPDGRLLISHDRLGNGLDGAPGPNGPVDAVFAVRIRVTKLSHALSA